MLLNDLYTIESIVETEGQIQASLALKPDHAIFKGHFPGQPVLPGVCMMEMVKEIAGLQLKKSFRINRAPMVKFLNMIDPRKNPQIDMEIKYQSGPDGLTTSGKIFQGTQVFMKFQMELV